MIYFMVPSQDKSGECVGKNKGHDSGHHIQHPEFEPLTPGQKTEEFSIYRPVR